MSNIPTEFKVPADKLAAVLVLTQWYGMMPTLDEDVFHAGDRFHENVNECQMSLLPDHPFFETGFCSHLEIRDGVLHAALDSDQHPLSGNEEDPYVYVPFVAE